MKHFQRVAEKRCCRNFLPLEIVLAVILVLLVLLVAATGFRQACAMVHIHATRKTGRTATILKSGADVAYERLS
jgi:hypothetical protein